MTAHFVYLALTAAGRYYCGYARDPSARIAVHNAGKGAKSLRGQRPVRLVYARRFTSRPDALRYESALKAMNHQHKRALSLAWLRRRRRA